MACRLFGAKPLSEPMLGYWQYDSQEQTSVKFESKYKTFHSRKCIWKYCLRNGVHFVLVEMRSMELHIVFTNSSQYITLVVVPPLLFPRVIPEPPSEPGLWTNGWMDKAPGPPTAPPLCTSQSTCRRAPIIYTIINSQCWKIRSSLDAHRLYFHPIAGFYGENNKN